MIDFDVQQLVPMVPELFLAVSGLVLIVLGVFCGDKRAALISWLTAAVFAIAACLVLKADGVRVEILSGLFVADNFSSLVKILLLVGLIFSVAFGVRYNSQEKIARFEYPILMLFAGLGMMMMVSAHDLLSLYLGLELQSLAAYVLASIKRDDVKSSESGLKYFVLGSISSGMLLFGASLIYGYTGSTNFDVIGHALANQLTIGALIGMVFVMAGLAFKISAAPFHMWTPDVYEGAPTSVTAFFAMVPKIAAVALLMRLLVEAFPAASAQWGQIVWALSAVSMAVGAFAALMQDNIKRLLAYSSVGNMGFALVGLAAGTQGGLGAVLVYLAIYMMMTAGTFGIVLSLRREGREIEKISDLAGLSRQSPFLAYSLAILMFSMSGIPPLAGFFGKYLVFMAAVGAGHYVLAVFGVLMSVVAAYYYLRMIKVMFFDEPVGGFDRERSLPNMLIIVVSLTFNILFILMPGPLLAASESAVNVFFNG